MNQPAELKKPNVRRDRLIAFLLFSATAAVVVWQNSRVGVLWDISYILENATRIAAGDVPYRDFPFPYAPFTFYAQAAIIRIFGADFRHHIAYAATIGGFATVAAWRILRRVLAEVPRGEGIALLLAAPLTVLGVYNIFPHPFYDPDCSFAIMLAILLLLRAERLEFPAGATVFAGAVAVAPVLIKQNTGLAFAASLGGCVLIALLNALRKRESGRAPLLLIGGILAGAVLAGGVVEFMFGLGEYKRWTIDFAASRRTPAFAEMLGVYADATVVLWILGVGVAVVLFRIARESRRALRIPAIALASAAFLWPVIYLFVDQDASERAERLTNAWPVVLVAATVAAIVAIGRRGTVSASLPFVVVATVHGAFMSQQLWGSTYALWPFLMILVAVAIAAIYDHAAEADGFSAVVFAAIVAICLATAGGFYVYSNERLDYVNLDDGEPGVSKQPALRGLNVRGDYLAGFDELVEYTNREIPRDDGILMLPGEDLFYFSTGRRPRMPVVMFDHTINPLSSDEIVETARARGVNWLIVKNDLQLDENPLEDREHLMELLKSEFKHVDGLDNYEIYRRRQPGETDDDDDDDASDSDN